MTDKITEARVRAAHAHQGQKYGNLPYMDHLNDVVEVLKEFGFKSEEYQVAGLLHDTVEDTSMTIEGLRARFGDDVAQLVYAVTQEPGRNRRERIAATLSKTASYPAAIPLKLADRIANVRSCWKNRDSRLFMYQKEYRDFRKALRNATVADHALRSMWTELDELLGFWDPNKA